jgi:archaeosortase B (VPXXXP-CTERM-specific)
VITECIGLPEMLIFLGIVLAFPTKPKKKLWGLLFGIPTLYIINIFRMLFITVIANWNPKTFDFFHLYFWQVAGILIIGGVWLFWVEKIVKYERETSDIPS